MGSIDQHYYAAKSEDIKALLARMKVDLEKYAASEKATEKAIAFRQEIIMNLLDFVTTADETIDQLMIEFETEYNRGRRDGHTAGWHQAQSECRALRVDRHDTEQYRLYTLERSKELQPNLY